MNNRMNGLEGAGEAGDHFWLHYGTQFTLNGRTHTIEMSIPMPIGADEEAREQLLREADAGMNQLSEHVEERVARMLQRAQPTQGKIPTPSPVVKSSPQPRPASIPAPQTGPQPMQPAPSRKYEGQSEPVAPVAQVREREAEAPPTPQEAEAAVPASRPDISVSMPSIPAGESGGNLSLQQFIGYIRENLGLNPKQAMDILKIKTLSGINLREALEQLQRATEQEAASTPGTQSREQENTPTTRASANPAPVRNAPPAPKVPAYSATSSTRGPAASGGQGGKNGLNEEQPVRAFKEEINLDDDDDLEDLDDLNLRELSAQERVQARNKIDNLRETRGATAASPGRLLALSNVAGSQISQEQLQELIEGVWEVNSVKKLKVDQVEILISWAKEDDFVGEVEAVLAMLEEE